MSGSPGVAFACLTTEHNSTFCFSQCNSLIVILQGGLAHNLCMLYFAIYIRTCSCVAYSMSVDSMLQATRH